MLRESRVVMPCLNAEAVPRKSFSIASPSISTAMGVLDTAGRKRKQRTEEDAAPTLFPAAVDIGQKMASVTPVVDGFVLRKGASR